MKVPDKVKEGARTLWQGMSFLLGGLLLVDFLVCLIAALVSLDWLLNQFGLVVFTAVMLLLGILFFLPGKALGVNKLPRRLLGAGLLSGGLILVFYCVMYVAAFFAMMDYIKQVKTNG